MIGYKGVLGMVSGVPFRKLGGAGAIGACAYHHYVFPLSSSTLKGFRRKTHPLVFDGFGFDENLI